MAGSQRLGFFLVTGSAIAWSLAGFFTRLIPLDIWTLLVWRGLFGAAGLAAMILVLKRGRVSALTAGLGRRGWLFAAVSALGMVLFIIALRHTTVAHVSIIYAAVPFVAAGLGWIALRERPTRSAMAASLAALVGVAVMVGLGREGGAWGDLLALGMTLCMAAMMVIVRRFGSLPVMPAACLSALISGLVAWPFGAPFAVTAHDLILLALFGLVNSALGLALFTFGARWLPPIETALIGSLDAPLAPLWVWVAFGETPGRSTIVGGLIVFAAVAAHVVAETARLRPDTRAPISDRSGRGF